MSNLSIQNRPAVLEPVAKVKPAIVQDSTAAEASPKLATDTVEKSALSGAIKGGLVTAGAVAVPGLMYTATQRGMQQVFSLYMTGYGSAGAGAAGLLAGAIVAKTGTDSKLKGALIGAAVGAVAGAASVGALSKSVNGAAAGALFGLAGGAVGGIVGTFASVKK